MDKFQISLFLAYWKSQGQVKTTALPNRILKTAGQDGSLSRQLLRFADFSGLE